ncbi:hypothetical protein [Corynebacterium flavescens]
MSIITYVLSLAASAVSLGLSSFGVYSLLLETGNMALIPAIEALF